MKSHENIVVIGGGISGLTAAYFLKKGGFKVKLLETRSKIGGILNSLSNSEYSVDFGSNHMLELNPELEFIFNDLGINEHSELNESPSISSYHQIKTKSKVKNKELNALIPSFFQFRSAVRHLDRLTHPEPGKINPALLKRDFNGLSDNIFSGINEYGNYTKETIKNLRIKADTNFNSYFDSQEYFPSEKVENHKLAQLDNGLGSLILALELYFEDEIITEAKSISIYPKSSAYVVEYLKDNTVKTIRASNVIMATPANVTSCLLSGLCGEDILFLDKIDYIPLIGVLALYNSEAIGINIDDSGFFIPKLNNNKYLGVTWTTAEINNILFNNQVLFNVFIDAHSLKDFDAESKEKVVNEAILEIDKEFKISERPTLKKYYLWKKGLPVINNLELNLSKELQKFYSTYPNIYITGNYIKGLSVANCTKLSYQIAQKIKAKVAM